MSLPAFDATTGATFNYGGAPNTFSHTVGVGGTNRCLYVIYTGWADTNADYPGAATYGGVSMTKILDSNTGVGAVDRVIIFRLVNPATGANNVSVTTSGAPGANALGAGRLQAISLTNVDQTNPERNAGATANGNSTGPTVTVTSNANDMVLDGVASDGTGAPSFTMVSDSGRTQLGNSNQGNEIGASSREESPSASEVMDWTRGTAGVWSMAAISVQAPATETGTYEQEGYRLRNDNGSETTATWAAAQDTAGNLNLNTVGRLRILMNATGDPAMENFRLEYRKQGGGNWRKVT